MIVELLGSVDGHHKKLLIASEVRYGALAFRVVSFKNYGPDYYDRFGDDRASDHFATVVSMEGEQLATLTLPGPIMARDDAGLLYIRLSSVPDEREIGVYELVIE